LLSRTYTGTQGEKADGHVDVEDPLPADVLREHAAEEHADGGARPCDGAEDAERLVPLRALREHHGDDREHRRGKDRAGGALEQAGGDEHLRRRRESRQEREERERAEADHEDEAPTEEVAHAPAEQQEAAERERVAAYHPLQVLGREAEIRLDGGQRDVHDGDVEDDHQIGDAEHGERLPAPGVECGGHSFSFRKAEAREF
jgi:hypothetical protein